jgi:hypothetical protein
MGERPPGRLVPDPLVAVTRMCGLLCMCSTTLGTPQRSQNGGEPSSRQVDELLDERSELTGT